MISIIVHSYNRKEEITALYGKGGCGDRAQHDFLHAHQHSGGVHRTDLLWKKCKTAGGRRLLHQGRGKCHGAAGCGFPEKTAHSGIYECFVCIKMEETI